MTSPKDYRKLFPATAGEYWWGGSSQDGISQPYAFRRLELDQRGDNNHNQTAPILLSSEGRYIWSDLPLKYHFHPEGFCVESDAPIETGEAEGGLRGAYLAAANRYFPPSGKTPPQDFFSLAQFNTWIEFTYEQSQAGILDYAKAILKHGFEPGILMIDDGWQRSFGDWNFRADTFPDPKKLIDELNELGFRVMLWVVPFVTSDTLTYRELQSKGLLLKDASGKVAIRSWWNGHSSVLDLSNPDAFAWMRQQLDSLVERYGVDGFKFDAGDFYAFKEDDQTFVPSSTPADQCENWAKLGLSYPFNEYRACWKMGNQPLVQRLWDKAHSWNENGLAALVPNSISQGLLGHAFCCPDMIGGGDYRVFNNEGFAIDQDLVVRMAQCSALMPMMQFSVAPWRILDERHLACCLAAAKLHREFSETFWKLAQNAAQTGEPILRCLAYEYPNSGYEQVTDQFLLGSDILVAPVLEAQAKSRRIVLPAGDWKDDLGESHHGPVAIETPVTLERLPRYFRLNS